MTIWWLDNDHYNGDGDYVDDDHDDDDADDDDDANDNVQGFAHLLSPTWPTLFPPPSKLHHIKLLTAAGSKQICVIAKSESRN